MITGPGLSRPRKLNAYQSAVYVQSWLGSLYSGIERRNIFVIGQFQGTADFGTGSLASAGYLDIFVAKYAPDGRPLWAKRFGGPYDDLGKPSPSMRAATSS